MAIGAAGGAGGTVYVKGKLEEVINWPVIDVHAASKEALTDLRLPIIEDRADSFIAKLKSTYADGKNVWIDIKWVTDKASKIVIRVGLIGDLTRSQKILERIKSYL